MQPQVKHREWESAAATARLAGTTPEVIRRLAQQGLISVRRFPGCDPRYLVTDIERIAQQVTRPACPAGIIPLVTIPPQQPVVGDDVAISKPKGGA